ncbi:hypothetical protein [Pseudoclavibacter sp. VKM Ac-2888]|uniref:hypothetical protein n=1 Tax=Pseudoclavibacter sp. VKM Ac-2888 TaxID=2783830 RepID=UPI00188D889A|nr:hypothetical protein [Pseudoclavibacter sp. VKM Ac-2888]MBF4552394.1 hypothetical protein [Pseudoclavibacter sp. VKM Ac-2888]
MDNGRWRLTATLLTLALGTSTVLAGCSATPASPTESIDYQQSVAEAGSESITAEVSVAALDDGKVLRIERWESPECWTVPVSVTWDTETSVRVGFETEPTVEEGSCPNTAAWVLSDITIDQQIPASVDEITVKLDGLAISPESSEVTVSV